jgi:hypothetical protein
LRVNGFRKRPILHLDDIHLMIIFHQNLTS